MSTAANFKCPTKGCKHKTFVAKHSTKIMNGEAVSTDESDHKVIACPKHNTNMIYVSSKSFGAPSIGKIASMTPQQRSDIISKRAKNHFKKEGKEQKHEILKRSGLDGY